ncbi:MAG: ATP-binding protein, partial [Chloroflexota bacterium]
DEFMTHEGLLFDIIHPEDRPHFFEQMQMAASGARIDLEHRIIRRDGTVRWIHKRFWLVLSPGENRIGGLMTDITDRKLAAEQAVQLNLENERMRILSGFVRDASHEFRTPLSIIHLRLDMMERKHDPEQYTKFIQPIRRQAERILDLVEALLLMSRLDALEKLPLESIDLGRLLKRTLVTQRVAAERNGITFTAEIVSEALPVQGERSELSTAIGAILDNAVTYTQEGGRIDVRCYHLNQREIAIDVADTGVGICEANQPYIFERFYRVDQAHSTKGIGLGLAITKRIVELHHGRIEFESAFGKGSLFRLIFPSHPLP